MDIFDFSEAFLRFLTRNREFEMKNDNFRSNKYLNDKSDFGQMAHLELKMSIWDRNFENSS